MFKKLKTICLVTTLLISLIVPNALGATSLETEPRIQAGTPSTRLSGLSRYQTAQAIGEAYSNTQVGAVILASGNGFPDALSASTLSKKLNAPILLVDTSASASEEAFAYIRAHVSSITGKIYIVGGTGIIGADFETALHREGYSNITRLGGYDRYDTNALVVDNVQAPSGTPVFIASGEGFPDALAASSFAGANGYPILLVGRDYFPTNVGEYLRTHKPSQVYIVGGTGVVGTGIETQIRASVSNVTRLAGNDRFDTTGAVVRQFALNPQTVYLANGYTFPDALTGGALAAKDNSPILLVDPSGAIPPAISAYLKGLHDGGIRPNVVSLGGTAVVPDVVVKNVENLLDGIAVVDPNDPLKGWVAPQIKSVAGSDQAKNIQTLGTELGFGTANSNSQAYFGLFDSTVYNPATVAVNVMTSSYSEEDVGISIYQWDGYDSFPETYKAKPIITQVFKFYLPTGYQRLVDIIDSIPVGDGTYDTKFTVDNREVHVKFGGNAILISKPGQKLVH